MAVREPARPTAEPMRPAVRWDLILCWLMRLLAVGWMAKGLLAWAVILGVGPFADVPFEGRATTYQAAQIYFAVIDLVAAVGLWLLATWGGVMWLVAVLSRIVLGLMFPRAAPIEPLAIAAFAVLIALFLAINWMAARSRAA
jgi:hypothetical protein